MGFFDSFPPPEPPRPPRRPRRRAWRSPGRNVKPVALGVDGILVRHSELAVYVNGVNVFPDGFTLTVNTLRRQSGSAGWGSLVPGIPTPSARVGTVGPAAASAEESEGVLRIGVRFADGRGGVARRIGEWRDEAEPPAPPVISIHSGHGNESEWNQELWVWGIPEEGDVELVYSWLAEEVPESRFALNGDDVREAAARAVTLWDEPEDEHGDA